ncbi:fibrobacter succinogenes major paralogous domain-containing protein [Fibrobacter sp. UWEL]|uniref:fibrobacter succinogenes major paralogous domain-containing protein n=1 Tax=Fibrobacter sp. UWEL TaxID=1896209 RepID=UPI0009211D3E|nr:FISUMP domain-containing protein [Fibrobacter sp. UWEL]SHK71125.1 major paralogous domain-containing protein [Fibrobacter sp. UWEL]
MKISKIAGFAIPLTLIACGDSGTTENITNNYTSGMEIVDLVSSLPKCTADNEGDQVWVKEKGAASICVDGKWNVIGGSGAAADFGCETKNLADGSGVAIYCAGDSIGVVLNGKDGADGAKGDKGDAGTKGERGEQGVAGSDGKDGEKGEKGDKGDTGVAGADGKDGADGDPGVGCKVVSQTEDAVTIQCGDDQFSMNLNGGSGEVVVPGEDVVSLAKLSGVSQKGPFINGSTVTLFELDGSRSLVQTGRTFGGEIITDDGRFSVNNVSLKSSYVRLTANGFYRNEVSGKNSTSSIVLNAYSDLQARNSVNINLLTHLEYYRVGYLMENGLESTIKASKKRAQKEIFAAFGIDNNGFGYSEDLDVFGEGDQNAALLAISILLQGDRSEADLSGLLASFGKDIEEDGKWDDKATRGTIAKWAADMDNAKKYGVYRGYVKGWSLGSVPGFEKYLRNFWSREYGLGVCGSDTVPVGTVKNATNSNGEASKDYAASYTSQANKKRFICVDADSIKWRVATDIEKDTAGWGHDFKTGDVRNGRVNANLVYVYEDNKWRLGTAIDSLMYKQKADGGKACTEGSLNDTSAVKVNGLYYVCATGVADTSYRWVKAPDIYNDTYEARSKCSATTDGDLMNGRVNTGKVYACNGTTGWREVTDGQSKTLGGCYTNLIDSVGLYSETYYVCRTNGWVKAAAIDYDTYRQMCSSEDVGQVINGVVTATNKYYCSADGWKSLMGGWSWAYPRDARLNPNITYGTMTDMRDNQTYKIVTIGTQTWMAQNLNYDYNEGTAKSYCYYNEEVNCEVTGRLYLWSAAMDSAAVFSDAGKGCGYGTTCAAASTSSTTVVRGVCPEGWHLPSNSDWSTLWRAIGGTSTAGTKLKSTSGWNSSGNGEDAYGFSVLPAGLYYSGSFGNAGDYGDFWSSTEYSSNDAYGKYFDYDDSYVDESYGNKDVGFSVRCLRDSN